MLWFTLWQKNVGYLEPYEVADGPEDSRHEVYRFIADLSWLTCLRRMHRVIQSRGTTRVAIP